MRTVGGFSIKKFVARILMVVFLASGIPVPNLQAAEVIVPLMPAPGQRVALSLAFTPAQLQGLSIHPDNALKFDVLIQRGQSQLTEIQKKDEYAKLVKYFLAALTVPEKNQWVNLSPYEKNRIIEDDFGKTEMGRDLLSQDYLLKQITSSLMYPESGLGKSFWDKVYAKAYQQFGNTNIPVNTFNKVWIVPDQADVYESGNSVYILRSHLKVMLEEDYLAMSEHEAGPVTKLSILSSRHPSPRGVAKENSNDALPLRAKQANLVPPATVTSEIIRQVILPSIEHEVNEGKNFALLRQIYSGMILATWYKKLLKESLLGKIYADKAKVKGTEYKSGILQGLPTKGHDFSRVPMPMAKQKSIEGESSPGETPNDVEVIYDQYLKAFKKGVYNYIKEEEDKYTRQIISRKYFAGGFDPATTSVFRQFNRVSQLPSGIKLSQISDIDRAQVVLNQNTDAAMSSRDTGQHKKLFTNQQLYNVLLKMMEQPGKYDLKSQLLESYRDESKQSPSVKFIPQVQMQGALGLMYRAPPEMMVYFDAHGDDVEQIRALVRARIEWDDSLDDGQKAALKVRMDKEINSSKYKQMRSLFTLLTVWVKRLRHNNADAHIVYLARDAGFMHLIEGVMNPDSNSSVYHLSRARMSGEEGDEDGLVYKTMSILIEDARELAGKNYELFKLKLQGAFEREYLGNPRFRRSVDLVQGEMKALGYGREGKSKIIFVDTGFAGTIPLFLSCALALQAKQDQQPLPEINVSLIQPSSINEFAKEMFGYELMAFDEAERNTLQRLESYAGNKTVGNDLEEIDAHPIRFNKKTMMIETAPVGEQIRFYYEQVVAVAAVRRFLGEFEKAGDDEKQMTKIIERLLKVNFNSYIIHNEKYSNTLKDMFVKYNNVFEFKGSKKDQFNSNEFYMLKENIKFLNDDRNIAVIPPAHDPAMLLKGIPDLTKVMKFVKTDAIEGGSTNTVHQKYRDDKEKEWFFKSPPENRRHRVFVEKFASRLAQRIGLKESDDAFVGRIGDSLGVFTPWHEHAGTLGNNIVKGSLQGVTRNQLIRIVKEHALDWLISNHDSHGGSFLKIGNEGQLEVIDKGQAYKYFGNKDERLALDYNPNAYVNGKTNAKYFPIYNLVWQALRSGEFKDQLTLEEAKDLVYEVIGRIELISDEEFLIDMGLKEYAELRFNVLGDKETVLGYDEFIRMALQRKHVIREDFKSFFNQAMASVSRRQALGLMASAVVPSLSLSGKSAAAESVDQSYYEQIAKEAELLNNQTAVGVVDFLFAQKKFLQEVFGEAIEFRQYEGTGDVEIFFHGRSLLLVYKRSIRRPNIGEMLSKLNPDLYNQLKKDGFIGQDGFVPRDFKSLTDEYKAELDQRYPHFGGEMIERALKNNPGGIHTTEFVRDWTDFILYHPSSGAIVLRSPGVDYIIPTNGAFNITAVPNGLASLHRYWKSSSIRAFLKANGLEGESSAYGRWDRSNNFNERYVIGMFVQDGVKYVVSMVDYFASKVTSRSSDSDIVMRELERGIIIVPVDSEDSPWDPYSKIFRKDPAFGLYEIFWFLRDNNLLHPNWRYLLNDPRKSKEKILGLLREEFNDRPQLIPRAWEIIQELYDKRDIMLRLKQAAEASFEGDQAMKSDVAQDLKAMLDQVGGIDLNAAKLELNVKKDGRGVPLSLGKQDLAVLNGIEGFYPNIIEITPVINMPIINELKERLTPLKL